VKQDWVGLSPDGSSLYTYTGNGDGAGLNQNFTMRRLDASTLQPLAERTFPEFNQFFLFGGTSS